MPSTAHLQLSSRDNPDCPEHPIPRWLLHDLLQQINIFGLAQEHLKEALQPFLDNNSGLSDTWQSMCDAIHTQERLLRQLRQFLSMRTCAPPPLGTVTLAVLAARILIHFDNHTSNAKLTCDGFSSRGVLSNFDYLFDLLSCLVDNALTHGECFVRLEAHEVPEGTRIDVSNDGDGIDPALTEFLGMPFLRLPRHSSSLRGLGLGLYTAAKNAELLGHSLELLNSPGKGCRLSVTLRNSPSDVQVALPDKCDPVEGAHILIMDKDIRRGMELNKLFTQWNCHSVYSNERSENELDKARKGIYDVIFIGNTLWSNAILNTNIPWDLITPPGVRIFVMADKKSELQSLSPSLSSCRRYEYLICPISPTRLRSILGQALRHRETSFDDWGD